MGAKLKYIIGWMTIKPGKRDRFLAAARAHTAATRKEAGCVFFELNLSLDEPNVAVVAECFKDAAAHDLHSNTPHMAKFRKEMAEVLVEGKFVNVFSDDVKTDVYKFGEASA
jgi:quinol monooxygenase YgiN